MARKKPAQKKEPTPERGIAWPRWTGFRGMTVRDWLQLLIIPFALVGIGLLFEMQQAKREERRAEAERELAEQRAQDEALQAYLDQMSTLLLDQNLGGSDSPSEAQTSVVNQLARARILTVLARLDPEDKASVLQFLYESGLIFRKGRGQPVVDSSPHCTDKYRLDAIYSIVDLQDADLRGAP